MTSIDDPVRAAVRLAIDNVAAGQFPFAALVVADDGAGEVLGTGVNTSRRDADPTAHGEVEAIRDACRRLGSFDLAGAIVVASCEPCDMCQSVAANVGIRRVVFAASADQAALAGFGATTTVTAVEPFEIQGSAAPFDSWLASGHDFGTATRPVHELRVAVTAPDHEAAVAFYRDVVGMPQLADWTSSDGKVVVLDGGRATLELIDEAQATYVDANEVGRRVAGQIRLALEVDDSASLAERTRTKGAVLLGKGPVDTPWGDRNVRLAAPADLQLTLFSKID
jgi:tRNA(Arg) A34 adenosine deaminase TadA/catechol 2,3-dioxygenase-like lactoylglutathione lyase family enzyme